MKKEKKSNSKAAVPKDKKAVSEGEKAFNKLPKEAQNKLKEIKEKLEKFQKKIVEKFGDYIIGVALLPPTKKEDGSVDKEKINVLVLVDDSDSKKMNKQELKEKLSLILSNFAKEIDENIVVRDVILSELWQDCYDSKYDILQLIAMSAPIYEKGMLSAIKIAEIHKSMILKKFEKYIVSYVLAGSLVQGRATKSSDIDVWVVIDDTDVKKMTRAELKDKLRAIIIGMGIEAGEVTGIRNKLNIQVYILTEFWDSLKEANPVIFTLLRDGVPFYDRGMFMPWKQLLKMGRIKPSQEAIDMFMASGDQMIERVKAKLKEMGMEDIYYAILTPSQAALMLYGVSPPTPRETPEMMNDIFVRKEKLLEKEYIDILRKNIELRKAIEHGDIKEVSGKDIDVLLKNGEKFLKRIKRLFTQIERIKEEEDVNSLYESVVTIIRDVMKLEGIKKVSDKEMVSLFEKELVTKGKVGEKYLRLLKKVEKGKLDYTNKKLTKQEIESVKKSSKELIRFLVEYLQRRKGQELEKVKIRIKREEGYYEILFMEKDVYIVHYKEGKIVLVQKARLSEKNRLEGVSKSSVAEMDKAVDSFERAKKPVSITEELMKSLKEILGGEIEIIV